MSLGLDDEARAPADADADERLAAERLDVVHASLQRAGERRVLASQRRACSGRIAQDELGRHLAVGWQPQPDLAVRQLELRAVAASP